VLTGFDIPFAERRHRLAISAATATKARRTAERGAARYPLFNDKVPMGTLVPLFLHLGISLSHVPADLRYTKTYEWVRALPDGTLEIGITDHAQRALGDLVRVAAAAFEALRKPRR
jgi:glycine cleavage system H protein